MTEDLLNRYARFLTEHGYQIDGLLQDGIALSFLILGKQIKLECVFPPHFPYAFPIMRISRESVSECEGIPHKFTDKSLCLFNTADAKPNFLEPEKQLLAAVERAWKIFEDGISGENIQDFQYEILEYWTAGAIFTIRCFDDFPDSVSCFAVKLILESDKSICYMVAQKKENLEALLARVHYKQDTQIPIQTGLFIPLSSGFSANEVCDEKKMWMAIQARIERGQHKQVDAALKRMVKNNSNLVVVSFPAEGGKRVFLGWKSTGVKPIKNSQNPSPFVYWLFQQSDGLAPMLKGEVVQCSQNYLYYRGSYGYNRRFRSATIVGCGAVGSRLAEMLCTMGTERLIVIDKEILSANNIARHTCGYNDIGFPKSMIVRYQLEQHNPNLECTDIAEDAFTVLSSKAEYLNATSAIFVAVGELPLEAYIVKLATDGVLRVPIVVTWVEPHCYAAHMIYIEKFDGAFEALVDHQTMTYRDSVINGNDDFVAHEPGCQSGFIPYSGLDVQQYLSRCLHELTCVLQEKQFAGNYHFTWIGELSEARRMGTSINSQYANVQDFSFIVKRFD